MARYIFIMCCLAASFAQFIDDFQEFNVECLGEGVFECLNGECIMQTRFCDGNYDCKDGSDENFCVNHKPDVKYCNETHQFLCSDGKKCIPYTWVCNFDADCDDKSDELNCTTAVTAANSTCKGFQCDGARCISKLWMCDGVYDCEDKTDEDIELTCRHALRPREMNNGINCKSEVLGLYEKEYSCLDRSFCVPKDSMCDGIRDCKDGSDEGMFCQHWQTMCSNFSCNGTKCVPDRSGPYCDCLSSHYQYNYTTQRCENINNCLDDVPWCSHRCERAGDAFRCVCDPGYVMDIASYLCYAPEPEAMLFFSTHNDIRYIKVKSKEQHVVVSGIKQAHGVSYDGAYIYWVETAQGHQAIVRAHIDNVEDTKEVLVALGLEDPGDIAVDWFGGNIYFTDVQRGVISVCKTDGSTCSVLHAKTRQPRFVTLDPRNGKMYWADWHDKALILVSRMDGTQPEVLVDRLGDLRPTGLALDSPNERLYFVDGTVKVVKLFDRKVYSLFEEPFHHPYSISVFENTVYWSDWTSETIQTTDKLHSADKRELLVTLREPVFDMHIYHPILMQQATNPCANSGCSHICVPTSNSTFSCLCPEGMELSGRMCKLIPEYRPQYLIVGGGSLFTRIEYSVLGNPEAHATHFDIGRVQAMAYDSFRDTLYLYDGHRKSINYINITDFTLGLTRVLAYNALDNVVDMGYENLGIEKSGGEFIASSSRPLYVLDLRTGSKYYVSDALYILDAGRRIIDVISLRTKQRTMIYRFPSQEIPISFCILPDYGRLVIAVAESEFNNEIHIDSIGLDGDDRKHLLTNNVLGPNVRLRYSSEMDIIYIADEGLGVIDFLHPEGTGREHFREFTTSLAGLAVTDTHVFWTDRHTERLYWADVHKTGFKIRRMALSIFPNNTLLHLQVTSPPLNNKNPLAKHACYQNSSPCSHICVQIPHPVPQDLDMGYKCLCPVGLILIDNNCVELASCKQHEHYCHRSNECFLSNKKCDGNNDCRFGEDEENCLPPVNDISKHFCRYDQKLCHNTCISKNEVCKEQTATESVTCSPTEERCADSSICIERSSLCDGFSDCPDGSDELPTACDTLSCLETEFMCSSGYCIPSSWRCDKALDCADGSDEINCVQDKPCPEGFYQCGDSSCIKLIKRCDGHYDCSDASDEDSCDLPELMITELMITCHQWEFSCEHNESICLPLTARCNGKVECPGGTDEAGCDFHCAPKGMYPCKQELMCVTKRQLCNGRNDCADGSDETIEACEKANKTIPLNKIEYPTLSCRNGYQCGSGQCIEWEQVCDNITNCQDGSDEKGNCSTPCVDISPAFCQHTPRGPVRVCPHGYSERADGCVDVDECAADVCSHVCRNVAGSFVCSCYPGYALRSDRRSCKALRGDTTILYTVANSVWSVIAHHHFLEHTYSQDKPISSLDYDLRNNKLYISVPERGEIIEINRNQKTSTTTAISNIGQPTKVAVDWITGNIYFVDARMNASFIRVCSFDKKSCARLHKLPSNTQVSSLVVDPVNHLMFYCIEQSHGSVVRSASLAGKDVADVATVGNCTGLAVDSFGGKLYVMDSPGALWKVDYKGRNLVAIFKNNAHIQSSHSPTIFEDHIYFLDNNKLNRCLLFGSKTCETYLHINATSFIIRQESIQREVDNVCVNIWCSNVCVNQNGPVCVCADGTLSTDGACPHLNEAELLLINGEVQQEASQYSISYTLITVVLVLFGVYLCVFLHYQVIKKCKKRRENYMQVRYENRPDGVTQFTNSIIEVPTAGGINHEFVNPLQYVRNVWNDSFFRSKPIGTAGLTFETHHNISDTESDIDINENKKLLRIR